MSHQAGNNKIEPVAIVGLGCRYPGEVNDLDSFWKTVAEKKDLIGKIPTNRMGDTDSLVDPNRTPGKIVNDKGAYLNDIEKFDAEFFGISPLEAKHLDPQQRLLLEIAHETLENSGIKRNKINGTKTGVYIGLWTNDFEHRLSNSGDDLDVYSTTGSGRYAASGRVSFFLNLQGPAITLDTACSSSLVAIHLAVQSIQSGETDMAFAGAANVILDPIVSIGYSRSGLLSEYGRCKFGAADPRGYVRSEGAGMVLLKKLSKAIEDGDQIHAIIPGTTCNNDGQSDKYMLAPSWVTQEIMIRDAHKRFGIHPKDVQYIEAHGTGTKAGDPAEIKSVSNALAEGRNKDDIFYMGSVKTNFGHTEGAAGMAGLIKAVLSIKKRKILPNLFALPPNPEIPWGDYQVRIPDQLTDWPKPNQPLIAGVNAFGIAGTNAHVILKEFTTAPNSSEKSDQKLSNYLLPISAANDAGLKAYATIYKDQLQYLSGDKFQEYIFNIANSKSDLAFRKAISAPSQEAIINALGEIAKEEVSENIVEGYFANDQKPKIAFVFPGQGSQWLGMGKELYDSQPIFKSAIDDCEAAFKKYGDWSLTEQLFSKHQDAMSTIDVIQPALVAVEIALAKMWQSYGIQPDAVVGHSMGEVAAAYISGSITLDEAAAVICHRSQLMKTTSGKGAMGYVALTSDEMETRLNGNDKVSIAVQNSPKSVVISGDTLTLESLLEKWDSEGIFCRKVKVDVASHSPQMDPITAKLKVSVNHIAPVATAIPFWSTVQHQQLTGENLNSDYWVSNLRQPVKFADTIQNMLADGFTVFIEMSPHPVLTQAIAENIEHVKASAQTFGSIERELPELQKLQLNVGRAFCSGIAPNWATILNGPFDKIELPNYPWQKEYYWPDESRGKSLNNAIEKRNGKLAHPFLAKKIDLPEEDNTTVWESYINTLEFAYLKDHLVHETIVFPAAGYVEIALAVIEESFGPGDHTIENFEFKEAISIPEKGNVQLQVILKQKIGNSYSIQIRSKTENAKQWNNNGSCSVLVNYNKDLTPLTGKANTVITAEDHYDFTQKMGLPYGPLFQTVKNIKHDNKAWIGDIRVDETILPQIKRYGLHPTLLDGCLQVALNVSRSKVAGATYVPVYIEDMYVADNLSEIENCQVIIEENTSGNDWIDANLVLKQNDQILLKMIGFKMKKLEAAGSEDANIADLLYQVNWEETNLDNTNSNSANVIELIDSQLNKALNLGNSTQTLDFSSKEEWSKVINGLQDNSILVFNATTSTNETNLDQFYQTQSKTALGLSYLIQSLSSANLSPKIVCVTNGSQAYQDEKPNLSLAPIWGMGRVILNEHPEFNFTRIDISQKTQDAEIQLIQKIISSTSTENEYLVRGNKAFVARLDHYTPKEKTNANISLNKANGKSFKAIVNEPGIIDNLSFKENIRTSPANNEVEVEVKALGINFMNLMSVLGIYPGKENGFATLGIECSGVVTKVGKNVSHLNIGDEVLGMAYDSMASHVILNAGLLRKKPANLSFEEAATIPAVFLTSYYALIYLGRLKKGERVLIHSATGGVGLSAIQIAKSVGAEIYATAGTKEKRDLLTSLGVQNVYNSRTLEFANQIKEDTNGEGIDLVLNSLTGEAMIRSMELLRSFGRFLEIGKKDVYDNSRLGLSIFDKAISYSMIDLEKMLFETPDILGELLGAILKHFEDGSYQPLQYQSFGISKAKEAFEFMSKAKHLGKIIISVENENPEIELLQHPKKEFSADATYLLTGGYGGLGITFANWMVDHGARNLILVGRSGPKPFAQKIIDELTAKGAIINIVKADVGSRTDLEGIISKISLNQPLKGIMHLAGILDDAAISNLGKEQFERVLKPKVNGAWHLHELTKNLDVDFFVLFSSSAGLFGSPGQAAYVAANTYLDQLAASRKNEGLEALSINWGTVSDIGLAAEAGNRADRLAEEGVLTLSPSECLEVYETIADANTSIIGAFRFDLSKWQKAYLSAAKNPFFDHLRSDTEEEDMQQATSFIEELQQLNNEDSLKESIQQKLKELVGGVVKKAADKINIKTPFKSLGIDSLMSIQLKNKLESAFEIPISVTSFWTYSNIRDYTKFLIEELALDSSGESAVEANETPKETVETKVVEIEEVSIDDISDDDISDLLAAELNDL